MGRARFLQRKHRAQSLSFASTAAAAAAKQLWHARYRPPAPMVTAAPSATRAAAASHGTSGMASVRSPHSQVFPKTSRGRQFLSLSFIIPTILALVFATSLTKKYD